MGVVRFQGKNFLRSICKVAKECGSIVIADEVTTGFGGQGYWFGYQYYGILPGMVICGKALGNGYPVRSLSTLFIRMIAIRTAISTFELPNPGSK